MIAVQIGSYTLLSAEACWILTIQTDNEYDQDEVTGQYFARVEEQYRKNGIVVPLYARIYRPLRGVCS